MQFNHTNSTQVTKISLDNLWSDSKFWFVAKEFGTDSAFCQALLAAGFHEKAVQYLYDQYHILQDDEPDTAYSILLAETSLAEWQLSQM